MKKTVITVVGKDSVGIIAKICTYLANNQINILDISQTIVEGFWDDGRRSGAAWRRDGMHRKGAERRHFR